MNGVWKKSFGGLSREYYVRQFVFGLVFPAIMFFGMSREGAGVSASMIAMMAVNTLLYPYARFVYESIVQFVMGGNLLFVNVFVLLLWKFITMAVCWTAAVFIAPIGLVFLFFRHSRASAGGG